MNAAQLLKLVAAIPPEAYDAIVPHGPVLRSRGDLTLLHAASLPAKETFAVSAALMAHELVGLAIESEVRGQQAVGFVKEFIDDWCGTSWPRKWPWPGRGPRPKEGPQPEPWDASVGRVIGATVFAAAAGRLAEGALSNALLEGAENLAKAALRGR